MKKLCFLWYWGGAEKIYPLWRDGLRAAIEEIGKTCDIDIILGEKIPEDTYDSYLIWGDSNCPAIDAVAAYKGRKGIILTTDPHNTENLKKLDVVFCESTPVYEAVRRVGIHAVRAFGTDTNYFVPLDDKPKDIDYFYPATFSPWKRQRDIAYLGDRLVCVGTVQPDGEEDYLACKENGVRVTVGYFPVEDILKAYQRADKVIIPAIHGSERTVLEAMSCDILPMVTNEKNVRTRSYLEEYKKSGMKSPREFVVQYYNPVQYAEKIMKGLEL